MLFQNRYKITDTVIKFQIKDFALKFCYNLTERSKAMIRITLSRKLGELRWTQADLARATGIRPSTINDLYHDMAARVSLEHLDLICEVLNCDLSEIIVYEPNRIRTTKNRTGNAPKDE